MNSIASYSNTSSRSKLVAPVGHPSGIEDSDGVWTAYSYRTPETAVYENNYNKLGGTSFASPQVAGAYAVMRQRFSDMKLPQMTELLHARFSRC